MSIVHVFSYGTLMIAQVMEAVTGQVFETEPALVAGFARYGLRGESYPALVPEASCATDGVLWRDVDMEALQHLDAFEGDWYQRISVQVMLGDPPGPACTAQAETYVLVETQRHRLNHRRWSRDRFETHRLPQFLREYCGFTALPPSGDQAP
ncbi:MAG: gamma-glutamylcyclotransferase [Gemmatimonadetes bacterium]|mgnify:CR=1 FL=1|nr:gamma-glutamylcyclotransferase [Gemmatimonadota bacterium]MBT6144095.1 gamma-glutamylcyclotransferase [Gemmatimonadota bacterium]MBT7864256.1 gamma-glutamylcyclotransferase [Gemmatimonadota bacterium]